METESRWGLAGAGGPLQGYRVSFWGMNVSGEWTEVVEVLNATQLNALNKSLQPCVMQAWSHQCGRGTRSSHRDRGTLSGQPRETNASSEPRSTEVEDFMSPTTAYERFQTYQEVQKILQ